MTEIEKTANFSGAHTARQAWMVLLQFLLFFLLEKGKFKNSVVILRFLQLLLSSKLNTIVHPQLLLLDELGYLPIDKRGADLMFQVVAARYETGSIVLSTNRVFKEWGQIFDVDNTLATAMIDRLKHHGEAIVIQGDQLSNQRRTSRIISPVKSRD